MTLQITPAFVQSISHPANLDRNWLRAMFGGRTGVARYGDFAITPGGVTRQFTVAGGRAFILGRENGQQGGYFIWSDGSETLTLPNPSGSPRIDTLVARVYDDQYGTVTGQPRAEWEIVQGTPASNPVARPDSDFLSGGPLYKPGAWWRVSDFRTNTSDTTIPANQIYAPMDSARVGGRTFGPTSPTVTGFGGLPSDAAPGDRHFSSTNGWEYYFHTNGRWYPVPGTVIARAGRATNTTDSGTESLILRLDNIPVVQGGLYTVHTGPIPIFSATTGNFLGADLRVNEVASPGAGVPATPGSSPLIGGNLAVQNPSAFTNSSHGFEVPYTAGVSGVASIGLFGYIVTGGGTWRTNGRSDFWVEASGVDPGNTGLTA